MIYLVLVGGVVGGGLVCFFNFFNTMGLHSFESTNEEYTLTMGTSARGDNPFSGFLSDLCVHVCVCACVCVCVCVCVCACACTYMCVSHTSM